MNRPKITRKQKWGTKQEYGYFKQQTCENSHEKSWTWLRKENLNRETESLLIPAQNNAIRTDYIIAKIDKTQQNSKCRLCGDRDGTINHIISECSKLAQKSIRLITTGWARWSTGNCTRNRYFTIRTSGICTTQKLCLITRRTNDSETLR